MREGGGTVVAVMQGGSGGGYDARSTPITKGWTTSSVTNLKIPMGMDDRPDWLLEKTAAKVFTIADFGFLYFQKRTIHEEFLVLFNVNLHIIIKKLNSDFMTIEKKNKIVHNQVEELQLTGTHDIRLIRTAFDKNLRLRMNMMAHVYILLLVVT
ncbi:hypothetical protein LXL04_022504 [Taraxacum kok-saghyz]